MAGESFAHPGDFATIQQVLGALLFAVFLRAERAVAGAPRETLSLICG